MIKRFAIMALMAATTLAAWANPVEKETARQVAENFWRMNGLGEKKSPAAEVGSRLGVKEMYVFAWEEGGYVIVAGDDCALPILGYSPASMMADELPANMAEWLEGYAYEIAQMREHGIEGSAIVAEAWSELIAGTTPKAPLNTPVAPLLSTTWGQGTYYNSMCPVEPTSQQHAATGCVGTAMAQVMKYWNHPLQGRGFSSYSHPRFGLQSADFGNTTYDWANMPNSLNASSTQQQVAAVASLMYQVGVSIVTNYAMSSEGGSSADPISRNGINYPCVENALRQYFDYAPEIFGAKMSGLGDEAWRELLRNEMDNARPVIYSGYDFSGGHCFVCDGYDSQDRFHFNWGWGGTSDGYFAIGSLNPSVGGIGTNATSSFNRDNVAVMGIRPATRNNAQTAVVTATSTDNAHSTVSGAGTYNNYTDLVTLSVSTADGYRFERWSDGSRTQPRQFWANGDVDLTAIVLPVVSDTIAYCSNAHEGNLTNRYFGIKVESANLPAGRSLKSVMVYNAYEGDYTIKIYSGDNYSPGQVAYEETFHLTGTNRWETLRFSQLVPVNASQPLWIVGYCRDNGYPSPVTTYCGNINGGYTSVNGVVWSQLYDMTVMLKALFATDNDVIVAATANDTAQGRVTGGGRYVPGELCTLTALPTGDNAFDHWEDGNTDNPRTFAVSGATTHTAFFSGCAISTLPHLQNFAEGLDCWTAYSASQANADEMIVYTYSGMWGSAEYFRFSSRLTDWEYDQYLISPRLNVRNAIDLSLSHSCYSGVTETFEIRYSTTDNAPASFTHLAATGSTNQSTWNTFTATIPTEAKYIAIHYTTQHGYYLYIDDITLTGQPLPTHTVTATAEYSQMGSVTGGGTYEEGETATLEATPNPCYEFLHWQDGVVQNPREVIVNDDMAFTAVFGPKTAYGNEAMTACDSAEWHGRWYFESTSSATYTTTTAEGCDSVATLMLTIHYSAETDTTIESDGPIEYGGIRYTESTTIEEELSTEAGCDSIVRVHIVINGQAGIERPEVETLIRLTGRTLTVSNAEGCSISVTDLLGRSIAATTKAPREWQTALPHRGAYIVTANGQSPTKIIVR
ncbi:MAG: C10 family peptidase [Bacteroidales bacterium]|nr:C10 family peptidase [Bacteroidales bacterium]